MGYISVLFHVNPTQHGTTKVSECGRKTPLVPPFSIKICVFPRTVSNGRLVFFFIKEDQDVMPRMI